MSTVCPDQGFTLRQAALIAGFGMLVMFATPFADFYVFPRLVDKTAGLDGMAVDRRLAAQGARRACCPLKR